MAQLEKNPPVIQETACNAGDLVLIPGLEKSPREGNGNTLQYSFLGNPMDRGAWQAAVHRVTRVRHDLTTKRTTTISQSSVFPSIENQNLLFFHEFGLFIN